jgi:bifunctional non-homologous end joining protein LigD
MLKPMLASVGGAPLDNPHLVYEPKYDGIRAIADVPVGGQVRLWSRLGNEKTSQFPEIAAALTRWAKSLKEPVVLDGEIVALDAGGRPTGFQQLQGRIHLTTSPEAAGVGVDTAYIVFDVLRHGARDLRDEPLLRRREVLERLFARNKHAILRVSEMVRGDGRALYERAIAQGWEGLIAKRADSLYKSGKRTPDWCKVKITREQEFVVGGWTEPRQTRTYFGALLLGVYDTRGLVYVGHTGTGFNERELARVMKLLRALETSTCPFTERPRTNERPHWVEPKLVAQIRFTEWTADAKLRHPVYLGLRDDKNPRDVFREEESRPKFTTTKRSPSRQNSRASELESRGLEAVVAQLHALEEARRDGPIELPGGQRLAVTNLHKVFWPKSKLTKGDLFRYYVTVAPFILPAIQDRPLVMKRFPNGVAAKPFYQHRVADVPPEIRVETVAVAETRPQLIGGDLLTLLYTTQLAAISQDPWFSRVQSPESADYAALDLDPMPGLPFSRTLDVARWVHDELESLGAEAVAKTSGAEGLHIYLPLPPGTPYEAGQLFCQIIATVVAQKHSREATVERTVAARGKRVYIDFMQNVLGKTLATAYSARASDYAGVSTPLTWQEIHGGVDREAFTIHTVPDRLKSTGDLWARLRKSKGVELEAVSRYLEKSSGGSKSAKR